MAHARTETLRDSQRRRLPFNLPPTGRRIDSKPGLEPLRDGDDVNLASESEEFGAANATNKDMRGAQTRTPALMPRSRTSKESTKKTSASQAEGGQACILCTIAVLLIMLVATSTTTVIVVLHWSGTIKWIPQLNDLLYE